MTKGQKITPKTVQKDLDFLSAKAEKKKMLSLSELNRKLKGILKQDTRFLINHGFLDYSLLVAIEGSDQKFNYKKIDRNRRISRGIFKRARNNSVHSNPKKHKISPLLFIDPVTKEFRS